MGYQRVLPRDAFNEGNLLKCIGRFALLRPDLLPEEVDDFEIDQDPNDGSIFVGFCMVLRHQCYQLNRPLNSRQPWPLQLRQPWNSSFEDISVFNDEGNFSPEMLALLKES